MSTKDTHAVQTIPQSAASGDLELKSVGKSGLVVTYHRNAYGQSPTGKGA